MPPRRSPVEFLVWRFTFPPPPIFSPERAGSRQRRESLTSRLGRLDIPPPSPQLQIRYLHGVDHEIRTGQTRRRSALPVAGHAQYPAALAADGAGRPGSARSSLAPAPQPIGQFPLGR